MTQSNIKPKFGNIGLNTGAGDDVTVETMFIPHPSRPGCGFTLLVDEQITLYRLGIRPIRCKSCGELITDREGA